MKGRFRAAVAAIGALSVLTTGVLHADTTEAQWTGAQYVKAGPVTTGYWPTSGSAAAQAGTVTSVVPFVGLVATGPTLPWRGPAASSDQSTPGSASASNAGPYRMGGVLGLVNTFVSRGSASSSSVVEGDVCASYTWGPATPVGCGGATQKVHASSRLRSWVLRTDLVGGLGATDVVSIPSAVSASTECDLSSSVASSSFVGPSAGNAVGGNRGSIAVRGTTVNIPPINSTATVTVPQGSLTDLRAGVTATIRNVASADANGARSRLTIDGRVTRIDLLSNLPLLDLTFSAVLVEATCGPGVSALSSAAVAPTGVAARSASIEQSTTAAPPTATSTGVATSTTTPGSSSTTTAAATTTPSPSPTTTVGGSASTSVGPTTTTTTSAAPTTISAAPTTTTTSAVPTTRTAPATTFTGSAEGAVTRLTTADGAVCAAADGGGLSCDDGTTISADAVTPSAVAAATAQGVWTPRTTDGAPVRVVSAVRG